MYPLVCYLHTPVPPISLQLPKLPSILKRKFNNYGCSLIYLARDLDLPSMVVNDFFAHRHIYTSAAALFVGEGVEHVLQIIWWNPAALTQ